MSHHDPLAVLRDLKLEGGDTESADLMADPDSAHAINRACRIKNGSADPVARQLAEEVIEKCPNDLLLQSIFPNSWGRK